MKNHHLKKKGTAASGITDVFFLLFYLVVVIIASVLYSFALPSYESAQVTHLDVSLDAGIRQFLFFMPIHTAIGKGTVASQLEYAYQHPGEGLEDQIQSELERVSYRVFGTTYLSYDLRLLVFEAGTNEPSQFYRTELLEKDNPYYFDQINNAPLRSKESFVKMDTSFKFCQPYFIPQADPEKPPLVIIARLFSADRDSWDNTLFCQPPYTT